MLFSTKAEYGVRLMVELGRPARLERPVSLSSVADAERLPLSYLEHLVAKLRKAGLVTSTARRPRRLSPGDARRGDQDADAVVEALEGRSPRWSASTRRPRARCSARTRPTATVACSTKLLWTRVQGGVTKALAGHDAGRAGRVLEPRPEADDPRKPTVGSAA